MQKVINFLALTSFVVSAGVVAGGVYVYKQKDIIINDIKRNIIKGATESIQQQLPGMLDSAVESPVKMPSPTTGPTGGGLPPLTLPM